MVDGWEGLMAERGQDTMNKGGCQCDVGCTGTMMRERDKKREWERRWRWGERERDGKRERERMRVD